MSCRDAVVSAFETLFHINSRCHRSLSLTHTKEQKRFFSVGRTSKAEAALTLQKIWRKVQQAFLKACCVGALSSAQIDSSFAFEVWKGKTVTGRNPLLRRLVSGSSQCVVDRLCEPLFLTLVQRKPQDANLFLKLSFFFHASKSELV